MALGTDPDAVDSDGDGLNDDYEIANLYDPTSNDTDGDGVLDSVQKPFLHKDDVVLSSDHTIDALFVSQPTLPLASYFGAIDETTYRFASHSALLNRMNDGSVKLSMPTQTLSTIRPDYSSTTPTGSTASVTPQVIIDFAEERAAMVAKVTADFKEYGRFEDEVFTDDEGYWWNSPSNRIGRIQWGAIRWNNYGTQNAVPVSDHTTGMAEKHVQVRLVLELMKDTSSANDANADVVALASDLAVVIKAKDDNSGSYIAGVEAGSPLLMTPVTQD